MTGPLRRIARQRRSGVAGMSKARDAACRRASDRVHDGGASRSPARLRLWPSGSFGRHGSSDREAFMRPARGIG